MLNRYVSQFVCKECGKIHDSQDVCCDTLTSVTYDREAVWWAVAVYEGKSLRMPWKVKFFEDMFEANTYRRELEDEGLSVKTFTEKLPSWRME